MAQPTAAHEGTRPRISKRLFTAEEYHRMAEAGILHEDDRVELIEGEILEMAAMGNRHAACVRRLNALLSRLAERRYIVSPQCPIRLDDRTEPQPDIALLKFREDFYADAHPGSADVLVAVEISDTSLEYDLQVKLPLYARAGIPEVWLIDLRAEAVEVHSRPASGEYRERLRFRRGETFSSKAVSGLKLAASDVLG